jgi:hypothetical protein
MLNSITNAMHATALLTYTVLVYTQMRAGDERYTSAILLTFLFVSVGKILGMIVHLPAVEHHRERHNFFWTLISVVVVALNAATLLAIRAPLWALAGGTGATVILCALYVHSLFTGTGSFYFIAAALAIVYTLCAALTTGVLQLAWVLLIFSQLLWMGLERVPWLEERKLHNDIYHLALIGSSFVLYKSIATGLWSV